MDILSKFGIIFLIIAYFTSNTKGEDVCEMKSPCSCVFPNGTGIDLSPTVPTNQTKFFMTNNFDNSKMDGKQIELTTYYYHPCYDLMPAPPINKTGGNDTCGKALAICRHVSTFDFNSTVNDTEFYRTDKQGVYNFLGSSKSATFSSSGNSIIYENEPSKTIVLLICAETDDNLHMGSGEDPRNLILRFYSRSACLKIIESSEGRSFGSTLLIIFFSLVIFYLVLGVCTKKFLMGATGIEVIPNLGFWTDLPNLVKDGWAFSINGFKLPARGPGPVTSPDPNSYDSI